MAGALDYCGRRLRLAHWLPGFVLMMLVLSLLGSRDMRLGVLVGAVALFLVALGCALLLWRHGRDRQRGLVRWVALCFVAVGLTHLSGPLLDPLGRSAITYGLGAVVQTALCLGLLLLSVNRAHAEAQRQAERFTQLAEHSLQALVVLREHQILYANPAARALFGQREADVDVLQALVTPELRDAVRERHARVLADPQAHIEWEGPRTAYDGRMLHLRGLSSHLEWDGQPAELLVMVDDTARQRALQALRRQALHDDLTGLPNRNFIVERLAQLTQPGQAPFALVSADLDRFQLVNETLGHAGGRRTAAGHCPAPE